MARNMLGARNRRLARKAIASVPPMPQQAPTAGLVPVPVPAAQAYVTLYRRIDLGQGAAEGLSGPTRLVALLALQRRSQDGSTVLPEIFSALGMGVLSEREAIMRLVADQRAYSANVANI